MNSLLKKILTLTILVIALMASPLRAQNILEEPDEQLFIKQATFLTGFSLSFINASRDNFNQEFEREFTDVSLQIDGLYFLTERIGIGPLFGYRFVYRDLEDSLPESDRDTRSAQLQLGLKSGWYTPAWKLFGGVGNTYFFVDGGISWLRDKYEVEPTKNANPRNQFGFQIGSGLLFSLGKRIALQTKLGFQTRRQEYTIGTREKNGEISRITETRWPKEVSLSVGLNVTF